MMIDRSLTLMTLAVACLCTNLAAEGAYQPAPKELHIHTSGNSYTASTFSVGLEDLLAELGREVVTYKTAGVAGATLQVVLNADGEDLRADLGARAYDVITLQSYYGRIEAEQESAVEIVRLAREHNPDVRVVMYTIWPTYEERYEPRLGRTEVWNEQIRDAILAEFPQQLVQVLPVSIIYREFYELIDAGQLPNVRNWQTLFSDGGHPGKYGAYPIVTGLTAMLYNESPIGYPSISTKGESIEDETAAVMQRVVWDALLTYEGARMNNDPTIATRRLQPAVEGLPFAQTIERINASEQARFTLADEGGPLPEGLALSAAGALAGTPAETGTFPLTVVMSDGEQTSRREYELRVDPDQPPRIATASLPTIPHGRYVSQTLQAEGGVGRLSWSLAAGELPAGISLGPAGFLTGVPGQSGAFPVTITVTDSHPQGAQTASRKFTLTVGEPEADTVMVRKYAHPTEPVLDGRFDEPYWRFDQARSANKAVRGDPGTQVQWDIFWYADPDNAKNVSLYIGVKVAAETTTEADAVHFFLDGNNNDEVIYNYDDSSWILKRGSRFGGERLVAGYVPFHRLQAAQVEIDEGWQLEAEFTSGALSGRGIIAAWPDWYATGFDLAVTQGTGGELHQQVWMGDEHNATETDAYGTIVFDGEAAEIPKLRELVNGNFADGRSDNLGPWFEPRQVPKHTWLRTTHRGWYTSWTIKPGEGAFQHDVKRRTEDHKGDPITAGTKLMQIIDGPAPGEYQLSFEYQTPRAGLQVGIWGASPEERFRSGGLTPESDPTGAMQWLEPQTLPVHGDETWHSASFPVTIDEQRDLLVLCFSGMEEGNVDTGVRRVRFEAR